MCRESFLRLLFWSSLPDLRTGRRQSDRATSQLYRAGRRSWTGGRTRIGADLCGPAEAGAARGPAGAGEGVDVGDSRVGWGATGAQTCAPRPAPPTETRAPRRRLRAPVRPLVTATLLPGPARPGTLITTAGSPASPIV